MKKVLIVGCPGSGKSYFARQLRDKTNLPLYYLDCIFWKENWEHLTREELTLELEKIFSKESWIIDGNYGGTLEIRFKEADTIFFLDFDTQLCIDSEKERRGKNREDFPSFLQEKEDPEFIDFIKGFKNNGRVKILELISKYPDKEYHIFKTREEKEEYLKTI